MADVLAEKAASLVDRLTMLEAAVRSRTRTVLVVGVLIALIGAWMVATQVQGNSQRSLIIEAVQEIRDCTTPDVDSDCQRRTAGARKAQSEDNLRASIAVGSCLRSNAPDVYACSVQKFEELKASP